MFDSQVSCDGVPGLVTFVARVLVLCPLLSWVVNDGFVDNFRVTVCMAIQYEGNEIADQ